MNDVDPSMKNKLIINLSCKATNTNQSHQSDTKSFKKKPNQKPRNSTVKSSITTDSITLNKKPEWNKRSNRKHATNSTNLNTTTNVNDLNEMKFKMSKCLYTADTNLGMSNNINPIPPLLPNNIRDIQTQEEIDRYTNQLYENILSRRQQQNYFPSSHYLNNVHSFLNQTNSNPGVTVQKPPSLMCLRPQINQPILQKPQTKKNQKKK